MKVVILAGGFGTRMSEFTESIPKPMVPIGGKPIVWHIMQHYASFGYKEFVLALGYKSEVIKDFFLRTNSLGADFTLNMSSGQIDVHNSTSPDWKVTLVDTGLDSLTGTRIRRVSEHLNGQPFMLTYGDGVSNVDVDELVAFHRRSGKVATMTAVRPAARFGELQIQDGNVLSFEEKPQLQNGWINGGFFVFEGSFLDHIPLENVMLEREPLESVTKVGQLAAFQHEGFWQCMDTKRDVESLQKLWDSGNAPWVRT